MNKITGIIKLIRPINCIIIGFAVLVGAIVANESLSFNSTTLTRLAFGFVTGFTFLAAANTVNDYHDRKIDAVNEPNRPIPSGVIKPNKALGYAAVLSVTGLVAAFFTNIPSLTIAVIAWFLFTYYATKGKRTGILGNLIVSACFAIPFIYGSLLVRHTIDEALSPVVIAFAGMSSVSTLGREITKGIVDVEGDKLEGIKTVAVLYGSRIAALFALLFYVSAVVLSFFPWLLEEVSVWYLPFVAVADLGFIFSSTSLLRNYSRENARNVKNIVRIWMVIGLFAFVAGVLG
ncbi:MAG: UbiA family prenyltransferase [Candidatus Bathyarchaeota archaeon]|nr:UbiA family prenyltransferase [Candidatus Bathyarchaeota archaeon]